MQGSYGKDIEDSLDQKENVSSVAKLKSIASAIVNNSWSSTVHCKSVDLHLTGLSIMCRKFIENAIPLTNRTGYQSILTSQFSQMIIPLNKIFPISSSSRYKDENISETRPPNPFPHFGPVSPYKIPNAYTALSQKTKQ